MFKHEHIANFANRANAANKRFYQNMMIYLKYKEKSDARIAIIAPTKKEAEDRIESIRKQYPELVNANLMAKTMKDFRSKNRVTITICDDIVSMNKNNLA
jgi:hypothetical protein